MFSGQIDDGGLRNGFSGLVMGQQRLSGSNLINDFLRNPHKGSTV